jgi:Pathogenicity locus
MITAKKTIKVPLSSAEKAKLKQAKVLIKDLQNFAADEIELMLNVSYERALEICALIEFQNIPSVGIKFAEDLVFMGYHSIDELKNLDGAKLCDEYERMKDYWIDPCVEDQFRLAVHYANTRDTSKKWWDFTPERKNYRGSHGYPSTRPALAWHEVLGYSKPTQTS